MRSLKPPFSARRLSAFLIVCALALLCYFALFRTGMDYNWQWNRAWRQLVFFSRDGMVAGPLLGGIFMTLGIGALGLLCSSLLGLAIACMRLCAWPLMFGIARIYINIFRNTPLLLQLFFTYFILAPLLNLGPFASAILALTAFEGAYVAEIFRAGLLGVNREQWESSLSLGFSLYQTLAYVILPQAFRNTLPAFTSQAVSVIKDSTLVSAIAVADLTLRAQAIISETFLAFEIWLIVAAIYLAIALCITLPALWLEKHQSWR